MWIDLTEHNGPTVVVNSDNITHITVTRNGGGSLVHLVGGTTLTVKEDREKVKTKIS
jgi:uncharacterized protein YlzI (FlbEa/FlbD family)